MKSFLSIAGLFLVTICTLSYAEEFMERPAKMVLASPAFAHEGAIPSEYTCDGKNISPPFTIKGVPKKAQSLILIVGDKESSTPPDQAIVWFIYNIPPQTKTIAANETSFPTGRNSNGYYAYQSPCPKEGMHHYYFILYALSTVLPDTISSTQEASSFINNHMVSYASLMGTYERK